MINTQATTASTATLTQQRSHMVIAVVSVVSGTTGQYRWYREPSQAQAAYFQKVEAFRDCSNETISLYAMRVPSTLTGDEITKLVEDAYNDDDFVLLMQQKTGAGIVARDSRQPGKWCYTINGVDSAQSFDSEHEALLALSYAVSPESTDGDVTLTSATPDDGVKLATGEWMHMFTPHSETRCRIVLDVQASKLLAAQEWCGTGFVDMKGSRLIDLESSVVGANDAHDDIAAWGLTPCSALPDWADKAASGNTLEEELQSETSGHDGRAMQIAVACRDANGSADMPVFEVKATQKEIDLGEHYQAAIRLATSQGYEGPFVCFDSNEFRAVQRAVNAFGTAESTASAPA